MSETTVPCPTCRAKAGHPCSPDARGTRSHCHYDRDQAYLRYLCAQGPSGARANACPYCYAPPGANCREVAGDEPGPPDEVHIERHGFLAIPPRGPVRIEPGPIVSAPRLRRRPPAEVAAYFDGAVAALRYMKAHGTDGIRVVDVDGLIALFESSRAGGEP